MDYSIKISKIKKSKIDNLIISINIVKPNCVSDTIQLSNRWKNASNNDRQNYILSFLVSKSFTEIELKKIYQLTTKLIIPWNKVFYLIITILVIFISFKAYLFNKLDRVYYIGSSITINPTSNSTFIVNPKLDKENILYSTIISSKKSFLKINDVENNLLIQEDNFINWVFGNIDNLKVDSIDFVQSKNEYYKYIDIFQPIINHPDFNILSSLDRKAIFNFINNNKNIECVSPELNTNQRSIRIPQYNILAKNQDPISKETLIYIRLKLFNNQNKNYIIRYLNPNQTSFTNLRAPRRNTPLDNLLFFQKAKNQGELDVYDNKDGIFYKIYPFSLNDLTN